MERNTGQQSKRASFIKAGLVIKRNRLLATTRRMNLIRLPVAFRRRGPDGRFLPKPREKECTICTETKLIAEFPDACISEACEHSPGVCLLCLQSSVKADLDTKQWDEIGCPECPARLSAGSIAKYADAHTLARYENRMVRMAVREVPGFTWCPLERCLSGQINVPKENCPGGLISVVCCGCHGVYCLHHNMAWHHDLTCGEFDIVLQGPPSEAVELAEYERLQEKMGQAKFKEIQRRAEEDRRQMELSEATIKRKTRQCPRPSCGWKIEKVGGCHRILCPECKTEFCWDCGAFLRSYTPNDDGHHHKEGCRHYPR